jgi:hypothetical protein
MQLNGFSRGEEIPHNDKDLEGGIDRFHEGFQWSFQQKFQHHLIRLTIYHRAERTSRQNIFILISVE